MSWNNGTYTDPSISDRSDVEANIATELNLFDMGDLGLLTTISMCKSIKESNRIRADFKFDIKYDLPLDFYIKIGYTITIKVIPLKVLQKMIISFRPHLDGNYNHTTAVNLKILKLV
jgi:hypothetical protein